MTEDVPNILLLIAGVLSLLSLVFLIAAGFQAAVYRRKLFEFEDHMHTAAGDRSRDKPN